MKKSTVQLTFGGVFVALGVIMPAIFHFTGISGPMFLPMHIPVLLSAFYLSPVFALLVGILSPLLSSILTGMPPLYPIGIIMIFELAAYGLITSILYKKSNIFVALIGGMISGRIVAGVTVSILQVGFGLQMKPLMYMKGAIITGVPGMLIQLLIIPVIISRFKVEKYQK